MGVMSGFSTESGERVFVYGADNSAFFEDAANTPAWKRYVNEFGATAENQARLGEILTQLHGNNEITLGQFVDALNAGMDASEFQRKPVELAPAPTVQAEGPRDKNGRPLTQAQQRWSEYKTFAESHSSRECRERARVDSGFATFVRKNLEREISGVGDAVQDLNAPVSLAVKVSDELRAFADEYRRTPVAEVRRLSRSDSNPNGYVLYNSQVAAATAAGLI